MAQSVFISHSSLDKTTADTVCHFLEAQGIPCWIAPRDVPPGGRYGEVIIHALEESLAVVLLFSEQSNASEQVLNEIERAVSKKKDIFPLKLDGVRPSGELEYFISRHHWLDCTQTSLEARLPELAQALQALTERTAPVVLRGTGSVRQSQRVLTLEASREGERLKLSAHEHLLEDTPPVRHYTFHEVAMGTVQEHAEQLVAMLSRASQQAAPPDVKTWEALRSHGAALYAQLLPPEVQQQLAASQATDLLLTLDEALVQLPWELLYDGTTWLCSRFNIGRFVSTQQRLVDRPLQPQPQALKMLIIADPRGDLEAAAREGQVLQRELAPEVRRLQVTLQQKAVSTAAVKAACAQYQVLHYAGHAHYDLQEPGQSGLLCADGQLTAAEVLRCGQEGAVPALVFCNGCASGQTAAWQQRRGAEQDIYGLANAFLLAGTHHYIGTFWDIPDESSARFAVAFYRALGHGHTIGAALKEARRQLLTHDGAESVVWMSYVLYGDPTFAYLDTTAVTPSAPAATAVTPVAAVTAPAAQRRTSLWVGAGLAALLLLGLAFWLGKEPQRAPEPSRLAVLPPSQRQTPLAPTLQAAAEAYQALERGDLEKANGLFQSLTTQPEAQGQSQGFAGLAALALARGETQQVLERIAQAETLDPGVSYTHVLRGHLLWQQGKTAEAVAAYRMATEKPHALPWQQAVAYNRLGRIAASQGEMQQALEYYNKALGTQADNHPDTATVYANKGYALASMGNFQDAMVQYRQAQQLNPADRLTAILLQEAERREKAAHDRDQQERIDQLVTSLVQAHKEGRAAGEQGDGWTSVPLTLAFLNIQTQGTPAARAGEEEALLLRLMEALQTAGRLVVLERDMLDKVLAELKLSAAELTDPQTAVRVGRILAARLLATGTVTRRGDEVQLALRVVETETTRLRAAIAENLTAERGLDGLAEHFASTIVQKLRAVYPLQGRLLRVAEPQVIINIGMEHGVTPGMTLEILQEVPLQLYGTVAGVQMLNVGLIEVTRVEPKLAQGRIVEQTGTFEAGWKVKER